MGGPPWSPSSLLLWLLAVPFGISFIYTYTDNKVVFYCLLVLSQIHSHRPKIVFYHIWSLVKGGVVSNQRQIWNKSKCRVSRAWLFEPFNFLTQQLNSLQIKSFLGKNKLNPIPVEGVSFWHLPSISLKLYMVFALYRSKPTNRNRVKLILNLRISRKWILTSWICRFV